MKQDTKTGFKIAGGLIVLAFVVGGLGLAFKAVFAPAHADLDRTIFENTASFVHGKVQVLRKMQLDYATAKTPEHKAALRGLILHEAGAIKEDLLPTDLANFIRNLRSN